MNSNLKYDSRERFFLWCLACFSFVILNSVFIYALVFDQEAIISALKNPVSAAFILEAFLLMATFSYLLSKWGVSKLHWRWFVLLSLMGSIGFALPVVLLWPNRNEA